MLSRAHSWLDRHPVAGDAALAAAVLALSLSAMGGRRPDPTVTTVLVSVLLTAPLVARRRAPVATFAAVMVACALELALVDEFLAANVAALVALYTLVAYAPRRLAWVGFAVALAGTVPFALRFEDFTSDSRALIVLVLVLHLVLAAMLGDRRHMQLAQRARMAELAAADERARMARELHDVIAHSLSVVIAQADGARYNPAAAGGALETISTTAREALNEVRHTLGREDAPLRPQPGPRELPALIERTRAAGLPVERFPRRFVLAFATFGVVALALIWGYAFRDFPNVAEGSQTLTFSDAGHLLLLVCYTPLLLWSPLLAAVTFDYARRTRPRSLRPAGARRARRAHV